MDGYGRSVTNSHGAKRRAMRWCAAVFLFASLAALCIGLFRAQESPRPEPSVRSTPTVHQEFRGIKEIIIRRDGQKVWELAADRLTIDHDRGIANLEGLEKATYFRNGKPQASLTSAEAIYSMQTDDVEVPGQVTVESSSGLLVKTMGLRWENATEKIICNNPVNGQMKEETFHASRVSYFPKDDLLECRDGVSLLTRHSEMRCPGFDATPGEERYSLFTPVRIATRLEDSGDGSDPLAFGVALRSSGGKIEADTPELATSTSDDERQEKRKRRVQMEVRKRLEGEKGVWQLKEITVWEEGGDYLITAPTATYHEKERRLVVVDGLAFDDADVLVTCLAATVYMRDEHIVFTEPVRIETKSKQKEGAVDAGSVPSEGDVPSLREHVRRDPTVIVFEKGEYFYAREKRRTVGNDMTFDHKRYKGSADRAVYFEREDTLELQGDLQVEMKEKGHLFNASLSARINFKTDAIDIQADKEHPITGSFLIDDETNDGTVNGSQ